MTMTINFFDLPREIRDLIYDYALISRTGYVTPVLCKSLPKLLPRRKPGRKPSPKANAAPSLQLHLVPCESAADPSSPAHTASSPSSECGCSLSGTCGVYELPLAYSLPRVSKQLYTETNARFWRYNTLILSNTRAFPVIMKHMGQTPSRQIHRVQLAIDPARLNAEGFIRAIKKLASRTRFGELKSVEIAAIGFEDWFRNGSFQAATEDTVKYSALCHALAKGQHAEWARDKVERTLLICRKSNQECVAPTLMPWQTEERTLEGLHRSWGGKLVLNGENVWVNGTRFSEDGDASNGV